MPYAGPFLLTGKLNNQNYRVQFNKEGKTDIVHHDKLKKYLGTTPPKWIIKWKETQTKD